MKHFIAALGLWFCLAGEALAADTLDIPPMDFQRFCEAKAAIFGQDENIRATCLREEKGMIDFLLKGHGQSFANVPLCLDAARSVGGSYAVLGLCLMEQKRQGAEGAKQEPEKESPNRPAALQGEPIKGAEKAFLADVMACAFPTVAREMGKQLSLTFTGKEPGDAFIDITVSGPMTEPGLDRKLAELVTNGTLDALKKWGYAPREDDTHVGCVVFASLQGERTRKYGTMLYDKKQGKSVWMPEADSLPVYDTKRYCARIGENVGGSAQIEKVCREEEKSAYMRLQEMDIIPKTLRYCDKISENLGGTYQMLKVCIEEETAARKSLEE